MAESKVRVGVRIRPLLPKEKGQNVTFNSYDNKSVSFKGQTYTYDHVFGMELSQYQLYAQTAAPMLKSFMEGYNCTIMAYGQTGSGKTFSMGTSDMAHQDTENQGLISRFVTDLFENLNSAKADGELLSFQLKASYLEIYGEDVYDLLPSEHLSRSNSSRVSLNVREDEAGKMFVQGQNEYVVGNAEATLELLSSGARHRITASTAMNAESSRSHSVFTLHLEQSVRSGGPREEGAQPAREGAGEDVVQVLCAKLTFVDLAGSERIKRTGAEGQRLKEGIQINSGLFNLGQVINSLADEQKLKSGGKTHVPYRNSKLTHLLKDALGGNSQTLFLACVSPAESNESETQSTLQYAKQARNIQNKPVQNVDKIQKELQRLRLAVKMWTMRAVTSMFGAGGAGTASGEGLPATASVESLEREAAALFARPDVAEFVSAVNHSISEKTVVLAQPSRKVRLSTGAVLSPSPMRTKQAHGLYSPVRPIRSVLSQYCAEELDVYSPPCSFPGVNGAYMGNGGRESILANFPSIAGAGTGAGVHAEPEETEKLLARMFDMVQKEKEQYLSSAAHNNAITDVHNSDSAEQDDGAGGDTADESEVQHVVPSDDIVQMDQTIQEKEEILLKLQETVKGYAVMKSEFEKLLGAINGLEDEKKELETELERAKRLVESSTTSNSANNSAALERVKERFAKVNNELKQMREEKKGKESAFRLMQRENKQCETLQKELKKLKESRVLVAKQQKVQAQQMQKMKKDQVQKNIQFKKSDVKKQQQVNTLKSELVKKERVLGHKDREIARISMKLKACEEHITQLLKMQNRARNAPTPGVKSASGIPTKAGASTVGATAGRKSNLSVSEAEHLQSSKAMLEHMLIDRLDRHISRILYDQKACQLAELNRELEQDAALLEDLLVQKKDLVADLRTRGVLPSLTTATDSDDAPAEEVEDEVPEEDVDLSLLCGNTNNGLSEEEKYQISQLKTSFEMCENSLERLTKEVDICNADIDELSLRIESDHNATAKASKTSPDSAWEEMGREIVAGLSIAQSHAMLWDLMDEKLKTLEQLRIAHSALSKSQGDLDQQVDKNLELSDWVAALRQELKTRLERAEKLRVDDMWALMQAHKPDRASLEGMSAEQVAAHSAHEDAASRIAILRAHELERELEISLSSEDLLKEQLAERTLIVRELQRKVSELALRAEFSENESIWTDVGGMISEGDHSDEVKRIATTTGRDVRSSIQQGPDSYMDQLFSIWEELGLPKEERTEALEYVQKSRTLAKERAVVDAQAHLVCVRKEVDTAADRLKMLCSALGSPYTQYVPESTTQESPLLLPLLETIQRGTQQAEADIQEKFTALHSVKDRLTEVMSEMWLEITDLPAPLRALAKLTLSTPAAETADAAGTTTAVMQVAEQLTALKSSLVAITSWESEIRKLNLVRVQLTSKLVIVRDAAVKLLAELQFTEPKVQLSALMKSATVSSSNRDSSGEDQLSAQAVSAAVQILVTNSASNPPGSEKLLVALERVKLVLESVKVNRSTVAQLTARFADLYTSQFPDELAHLCSTGKTAEENTALMQLGKENLAVSTTSVQDCFMLADAVATRASELNAQLRAEVSGAVAEVVPGTPIEQCDAMIAELLKSVSKSAQTDALVSGLAEVVEELQGMAMFVEEGWVQEGMHSVAGKWESLNLAIVMQENHSLAEELARLQGVCEAQRELLRADSALSRHIAEMDEFEEKSKHDRAKALSGNSRLLVEEEKFRKSGKKKYETLAEKMLQLYSRLNALTAGGVNGTAPHIDVKSTLAALSAKGKALLKGRFKEKIELMHLQLSTASASAGVGASSASGAVASHLSVPSTATGSNGPLSSKSAGSASGTGAAGAKKFGYPSAPANVFDFAADHNIAKSHSHDAGVEKGGIVLTGRNSSDSVGAVEKENRA